MVRVREVCKSYGGRMVLEPVSFCVPPGQCLGLAGSNGSGKSTLLRILAQVEKADGGDVLFEGWSVLGDRRFLRRTVGYVPQDCGLAEELTVKQQLALWQSACGLKGPVDGEILDLLGLEALLKSPISALSGGMKRRVSIAMALTTRPPVLLMDEVTAGLDRDYCLALLDWLEGHLRRGGYLLWCSHQQEELDRLCGSVLRLEDGKVFE